MCIWDSPTILEVLINLIRLHSWLQQYNSCIGMTPDPSPPDYASVRVRESLRDSYWCVLVQMLCTAVFKLVAPTTTLLISVCVFMWLLRFVCAFDMELGGLKIASLVPRHSHVFQCLMQKIRKAWSILWCIDDVLDMVWAAVGYVRPLTLYVEQLCQYRKKA